MRPLASLTRSSGMAPVSCAMLPAPFQRRLPSWLSPRALGAHSSSCFSPSCQSLPPAFASSLPFSLPSSCAPPAALLSSPACPVSSSFSPFSPFSSPPFPALCVARCGLASGKKKKSHAREDGREEDKRMRKVIKIIGGDADDEFAPADSSRAPRGVGGKAQGLERAKARGLVRGGRGEDSDEDEPRSPRKGDSSSDAFNVASYEEEMKAALDKMVQDVSALLVHRERAEHFERIPVSAGGEKRRLSDLAQVVVRGASTVHVHVFSEANLSKVMSALRAADPKWTLQQEGATAIRLQLPKVTPEMREELKTKARVFLVTAKSSVRNLRQAARSHLHKLQFKTRSIDDVKRRELDASLTSLMEAYVGKCDKVFNEKMQQLLG